MTYKLILDLIRGQLQKMIQNDACTQKPSSRVTPKKMNHPVDTGRFCLLTNPLNSTAKIQIPPTMPNKIFVLCKTLNPAQHRESGAASSHLKILTH